MTLSSKNVTVKHLPDKLDRRSERALLRELEIAMNVERPAIVLDCSQMREMDISAVHLLLCCLEEAMKRNGDVRLVAVSAQAKECLRSTAVDRLFRIFDTNDEAVQSFQRRTVFITPYVSSGAGVPAENAA
jgi:anti-sigma B factor antagonist